MSYIYANSKKNARKSDDINYLDKKLKLLSGIQLTCCALSSAALVTCAFHSASPIIIELIVVLGVNVLFCLVDGLILYNKHKKESEYIEKAKEAASSFNGNSRHNNGFNQSHLSHSESNYHNDYMFQIHLLTMKQIAALNRKRRLLVATSLPQKCITSSIKDA
ncbi:hypothetical protein [Wolbachia endosymbiont of Pentidionis agamae]|uniref:hypothetical protein n=1 Tax=Wolbachia endosymbiont of Pentidionis agamae TaxID=3110435 RepID=UPI002FD3127E